MSLWDMVPKVVEIQQEPIYKFTVDGVDFPWYITEQGPRISRIHDDFYVIEVDILLLDMYTKDFLSFGYFLCDEMGRAPMIPIINGKPFPWLMHEDNCVLTFGHKVIPTLNLKFFALQVITNLDVTDKRTEGDDVYCSGGDLIATEDKSMFSQQDV